MFKIFLFGFSIILASIAQADAEFISMIDVPQPEIEFPELKEADLYREVPFPENLLNLNEFKSMYRYICGGYISDPNMPPSAEEVLKSASTIFEYVGVAQKWVPINGKPEQFHVLKLQ